MNLSSLSLFALMGMLLVAAAPSAHNNTHLQTITGHNNITYTVTDQVFALKINDSLTISVRGTVQDAFNQLAKHDPVQAAAINATINNGAGNKMAAAPLLTSRAQDDDCCTQENYFCNLSFDADCRDIAAGIKYLKTVTGTPVNGPGPGQCNRVSCSWNSAIYWCNDNPTEYVLENFTIIADGAQQVMNDCTFQQQDNVCPDVLNGQQFYSGGWNVIVAGATC